MIFNDFSKALAQLSDPRFRKILVMGLGLTVALLVGISVAVLWLVGFVTPDVITLPLIGEVRGLDSLFSFAAIGVMMLMSVFLMVPVASAFTGLFLEEVADAVEDTHYPHLPPALHTGAYDTFRDSVNFFGVLVAVNALALGMAVFIGPLAPVMFWLVNGYLLGREYFQMVAMRRMGRIEASQFRRKNRAQVWLAGTLMAIPLSVPLINLLIPILGVATFTHLFHRLAKSSAG
ncbi:EI24 domain-containing protein [Actibacterium sp. XHP0104]|uniref:EI24 domain-containing protein n=1 Tax=Actibacterium sp. XHP0104 TaxID=2984335 RepID=UPI0021E7FD9B|nr:EI24 domain-containing protein [Actibacterium sp. XHP0104]MCV2880465.1 EI24 domain-containing protein [Actibacterium sp. XHP0104]